jgi:hypothetical protein
VLLDNFEEASVVEASVLGEDINLSDETVELDFEGHPSLFLCAILLEPLGLGTVVGKLALDLTNLDILEAVDLFQLALEQLYKIALVRFVPEPHGCT